MEFGPREKRQLFEKIRALEGVKPFLSMHFIGRVLYLTCRDPQTQEVQDQIRDLAASSNLDVQFLEARRDWRPMQNQ